MEVSHVEFANSQELVATLLELRDHQVIRKLLPADWSYEFTRLFYVGDLVEVVSKPIATPTQWRMR